MKTLIKLKNKIQQKNLKPKPFRNFKFISFNQVDQKSFFNLINKDRVKKSFRKRKNITYQDHLKYVNNYKNKPIINFVLVDINTQEIAGLFNVKETKIGHELGKVILKNKYLGKGIAKKATIQTLDFFFKISKKKIIFAKTSARNNVNIALNLKLGFIITNLKNNFYTMKLTYVRFYNLCYKKK